MNTFLHMRGNSRSLFPLSHCLNPLPSPPLRLQLLFVSVVSLFSSLSQSPLSPSFPHFGFDPPPLALLHPLIPSPFHCITFSPHTTSSNTSYVHLPSVLSFSVIFHDLPSPSRDYFSFQIVCSIPFLSCSPLYAFLSWIYLLIPLPFLFLYIPLPLLPSCTVLSLPLHLPPIPSIPPSVLRGRSLCCRQ